MALGHPLVGKPCLQAIPYESSASPTSVRRGYTAPSATGADLCVAFKSDGFSSSESGTTIGGVKRKLVPNLLVNPDINL